VRRLLALLAAAMVMAVMMAVSAAPAFALGLGENDQGENCPDLIKLCGIDQGDQNEQ
jgi:hypothetical protein